MADMVPVSDLTPGIPSRVVTIDTVDLTEGAPGRGWVEFILPADVHAPSLGVIVQAGCVRVNLDEGKGRVRLPAFDAAVTDPDDWVILVKKSWAPFAYPVRVPAGSSAISLAALNPVKRISRRASAWLLTSASVTVKEGANWDAAVTTSGGVAQFTITVPPGGAAYWRGELGADAVVENLDPGTYLVPIAAVAKALGLPEELNGILTVHHMGKVGRFAEFLTVNRNEIHSWSRFRGSVGWGAWQRMNPNHAPSIDFLQKVVLSDPSTRINRVADPVPVNAVSSWSGTRAAISQVDGWGRATASGSGATTFKGNHQSDDGSIAKWVSVSHGQTVSMALDVRAMPDQVMGATPQLIGYSGGVWKSLLTSANQVQIRAGGVERLSVSAVIPEGIDGVGLQVQFRRWGQTYTLEGDYLDFRRAILVVGVDDAGEFFSGSTPGGFWAGAPNQSASVLSQSAGAGVGIDEIRRAAVVDAGLRRRGRVIGTGGLPAIALRFDHHLDAFRDKVLPILKELRLPWGQMLNAANVGSGDGNMTWDEIARACYEAGGEVWNHSLTHGDVSSTAEAHREVIEGLDQLVENLPGLWIDGWAPPGQPTYMGYEGQDTAEKHFGTTPGRLILSRHALVRGYYPGIYQPLSGPELIGAPHTTIDRQSAAWIKSFINGVVAAGAGATLMLHPNYLDSSGYLSTADLRAVLEDLAARRDRGDLVVLSCAGILLADSARKPANILAKAAPGTVESSWSELVSIRLADASYGVPHEAEVWATPATSGPVTLRVEITAGDVTVNQSHTVQGVEGRKVRLGVVVTPPRSTTATTVTLTGNFSHEGVRYRPI